MHLPRDPGEWALMALLMVAVMAIGMAWAHVVRAHLAGPGQGSGSSHGDAGHDHAGIANGPWYGEPGQGGSPAQAARGDAGPMSPGIMMSVVTWLVSRLLALGVRVSILGPMMLLTVVGRKSGQPRTLPVDVHDLDGRRYLIASHGISAWVLNLRAAGEGSLRLGRNRLAFEARELDPAEAGPIIRQAFTRLVASKGWRGEGIRANLGVSTSSPDADYVVSAREHPVFELHPKDRPTGGQARGAG